MARKKGKKYWIQDALRHSRPGALHRQLGVTAGEKIPVAKLRRAAAGGSTKLARRARLALTLRKLGKRRHRYSK